REHGGHDGVDVDGGGRRIEEERLHLVALGHAVAVRVGGPEDGRVQAHGVAVEVGARELRRRGHGRRLRGRGGRRRRRHRRRRGRRESIGPAGGGEGGEDG